MSGGITKRIGAAAVTATIAGGAVAGLPVISTGGVPVLAGRTAAVELAAIGPFFESLQNLLDVSGVGTIEEMLAHWIHVPVGQPDITLDSSFGDLANALFPNTPTWEQMFDGFGIPIDMPLYSTTGDSIFGNTFYVIAGMPVGSPFIFSDLIENNPSFFDLSTVPPFQVADPNLAYTLADVQGLPIGNVPFSRVIDLLLGGANEGDVHSLGALLTQLGLNLDADAPAGIQHAFSGLVGGVLGNVNTFRDLFNFLGGQFANANQSAHGTLDVDNSSINDWVSGLVGVNIEPLRDCDNGCAIVDPNDDGATFGQILLTGLQNLLPSITPFGEQSIGELMGVDPNSTWLQDLLAQTFPGLGNAGDLGDQSISSLLDGIVHNQDPSSLFAVDSTTTFTGFLDELGLADY